jgi:hypothetical protein
MKSFLDSKIERIWGMGKRRKGGKEGERVCVCVFERERVVGARQLNRTRIVKMAVVESSV